MMNENERKLDTLKEENPFTSSSVGDPWEDKYSDVKSINERAFREISQLVGQKVRDPALSCSGLVFGEVGSGKTHLISRILRYGRETAFPFSFAYIQPIEDSEQTYRYLLREVIVNLCYPIRRTSDTTQMDIILDKSFTEIAANAVPRRCKREKVENLFSEFRKDVMHILRKKRFGFGMLKDLGQNLNAIIGKRESQDIAKDAVDFMRVRFPEIPKEFLKVLFQYQQPEKRAAVADWLKGIPIDADDAVLIGVSDRMSDSPAMLEQKARNILSHIGALLTCYDQPLVICFDRLENYDTDAKIHSLGKMIEFLVDKVKAMLPLVFVRGQQWEEKFTKKLNQQVITRLRTNEFQLKGCNVSQSLEIIQSRLMSVFGKLDQHDLFPFGEEKLTNIFKTMLHTPRQVIMLANQQLKQTLYPEKDAVRPVLPLDRLQDEFERQYEKIRTDFDRYPPDRSRLRRALELYLRHSPENSGFKIESLNHPEDKYLDFRCKIVRPDQDASVDAVFITDVELNHVFVRASLKRGGDFLEENGNGKAFYIRDARCGIPAPPKWKVTNELFERFRSLGGHVLFLDSERSAMWYALALLNYAVKEGDVTVISADNRPRSVSTEELAVFVQQNIHGKNYPGFQALDEMMGE